MKVLLVHAAGCAPGNAVVTRRRAGRKIVLP
jgi:hypothetical protein